MYQAIARWNPGQANVSGQKYTWMVGGVTVATGEIASTESQLSSLQDQIVINPGDEVVCAVRSFNPWHESDALPMTGTAPTPYPDPPTDGSLTFSELPAARRA